MKISAAFAVLGIVLIAYSAVLEPYSDVDIFNERYSALKKGESKEYFELREEMLSPKYKIQDFGISVVLFSVLPLFVLRINNGVILSPKSRMRLFLIAFILPVLTVAGFVFDLGQGFMRGEFPHWADSLGIPLASTPILFVLLLVWAMAHLLLIKESTAQPLSDAITKELNPWIIFTSIVTVLLIALSLSGGAYWFALPGVLWLYFYLSIGVARLAQKRT